MMAQTNGTGSTLSQHYQHHVTHSQSQSGHSVLVEGKLLQGEALLEYAQQKGLCPKCVQHVTHKRVRKKVGMLRYTFEWIPLTFTDELAGNYTVYKGYCLQPTCFTLEEAQNLLGEHQRLRISRSASRGRLNSRSSQSRSSKTRPSSSKSRSRRDLNSIGNTSSHSSISAASSDADGDTDPDFESDDYDVECVAMSQTESVTDSSTRAMTPTNTGASSMPNSPASRDVQQLQQQPSRRRLLQPQMSPGKSLSCRNLEANNCRTPRTPTNRTNSGGSDRTKRRVPDSDILRQLCRFLADLNNETSPGPGGVNSCRGIAKTKSARGPLSIASESDLWTILHKRYGEETLPALTIPGRIVVILSILQKPIVLEGSNSNDSKEHYDCSKAAWTLLAHLTKQQLQLANGSEDSNDESSKFNTMTSLQQKSWLAEQVLRQISNEFDRTDDETMANHHSSSDNVMGYAKRCAAQILYHMLRNEEHCVDSPVLSSMQALSPTKRHHWITVLLDMLLFDGADDDQLVGIGDEAGHKYQLSNANTTGTAENLYVVWNLLLAGDAGTIATQENTYVLKTIVGIAVSILSNYSIEDGCGIGLYSSSRGASIAESVLQAESAMGLLATVASRAGAPALAGRQYECLQAISETCTRYDNVGDVLLQGAHAICHILASFEWYHDDSPGGNSVNEYAEGLSNCYIAAEHGVGVVSLVLDYQETRAQRGLPKTEELNRAVCRLTTTLFESNEILQTFVVRVCLQQEKLVHSLLQMLDTTNILSIAESASCILVYLLHRDNATSSFLRDIPDIATVIVRTLDHYRDAPVVLKNLCVIVTHLVSLQDHQLGYEIGKVGGLNVLADLLMNAPKQGSQCPDEAESALRALTGIVSIIDTTLLYSYQASLVDILMSVMDRQHHQHRLFHCTTGTEGQACALDVNWDCDLALKVQLAALDALHALCVRGATEVSRAIQMVLYNMDFYSGQVQVLTRCCAIVRRLTREFSENPAATRGHDHIEEVSVALQATKWVFSLLRAMMFHPDATEFVLEGIATLKDLAANPSLRDLLEPADAEACLVSLLEVNSATRPDVAALAFAALNNVLVDRRLCPSVGPVRDVVVHLVMGALRRFPDDAEVWTNSLLLLKSYTYRDDNLAILRDNYSDELIPLLIDAERILSGDALERSTYIIRKLQ